MADIADPVRAAGAVRARRERRVMRDGTGPTRHGHGSARDRVEQAIAREHADEQIAADEGVSVERVKRIRIEMNRAVARRIP